MPQQAKGNNARRGTPDCDREHTRMNMLFADTMKKIRADRGLTQREMAERLFVTRAAVARWENGTRLPDAAMIARIANCFDMDARTLLAAASKSEPEPNVILLDDRKIILAGALPVLKQVLPTATVAGFTRPSEALEYAETNQVALAFLDIEMGNVSGLDICRALLELNPCTNVVFLTAYSEYALDAWSTGACGFMLKPITAEGVQQQLNHLRYPFYQRGAET